MATRSIIALTMLVPLIAAAEDGWSKLGEVLGGGVDREGAYMDGRRQQAEYEALVAEARQRQLDAEHRAADEKVRSHLRRTWMQIGFSDDEAVALVKAFEWTDSQDAVLMGVRRQGTEAAVQQIWQAVDSHNYLLANQLLVACMIVLGEEQGAPSAP